MKKIILIAYNLNPKLGSESGTADLWLRAICNHCQVEVFTIKAHKSDIRCESYPNTKFHFITIRENILRFFNRLELYSLLNVIFIWKTKKVIRQELVIDKFSLIHCLTPSGVHSWNDLYKLNTPVLVGPVIGGVKIPRGFEKILGFSMIKLALRELYYDLIHFYKGWRKYFLSASRIIIGTEQICSMLPKEVRQNVSVIFDACVDTGLFMPSYNPNRTNKGIVKILFIGKLVPHKGVFLILDACRQIIDRVNIPFKILIWGRGPLRKVIEEKIVKDGLSAYIDVNTEFVSVEGLIKIYQESDIFCFPALKDSGGMVSLEAMACGLPVITSNYGGPAYSVTNECGIKIEVNNYKQYVYDLSEAIIKLVEDEPLRKQMGMKARERVEQEFSLQAMEKKILGVYNEVLDEIKE